MEEKKQKLIVVAGATASGKSEYAFNIAKNIGGFLICADSRQIYKDLTILTGKDRGEWRIVNGENVYLVDGIPEYMVDIIDPRDEFSVSVYQKQVYEIIDHHARPDYTPILVGGTGLYISAVIDGYVLDELKAPDPTYRSELERVILTQGLDMLVDQLRSILPDAENQVDLKNPRRVIRALERFKNEKKLTARKQSRFDVDFHLLEHPRELLYCRINDRIDHMLKNGCWDEAEFVLKKYGDSLNAISGIGYRQLGSALTGEISRQEAVALFKRDTRRYAKRQMTWFNGMRQIIKGY